MILIRKLLNIPFKGYRVWYVVFVIFGQHFIHVSDCLWISLFFPKLCIFMHSTGILCGKVPTKCLSLLFSSFDAPNFLWISLLGHCTWSTYTYTVRKKNTYHLKWIFHPKLMSKQNNEVTCFKMKIPKCNFLPAKYFCVEN